MSARPPRTTLSVLDRLLRLFGDVRAGESATALLLLVNLFLPLVSYSILKVTREPLIKDAVDASWATGVQALLLIVAVPAYRWLTARVPRNWLLFGVVLFFVGSLELFYFGLSLGASIGFAFFVWLGIFALMIISLFWSFANDVYDTETGDRLFPLIAVGQTFGAFVGARVGGLEALSIPILFQIAAALLLVHLGLYWVLVRRRDVVLSGHGVEKMSGANGLALVFKSPYLRLAALLFLLLNLVNTTGEYILRDAVIEHATVAYERAAALDPSLVRDEFIQLQRRAFYGDFYSYVNVLTFLIQAFLVSRLVKYAGMRGVLFALPLVALGAYGSVAVGAGFIAVQWAKTAENSIDYSVMNTARALLWLPTTRDEKYKAKQTIDTFFVRVGDLASTALVTLGTGTLAFSRVDFAYANVLIVLVWMAVAWLLLREYRALVEAREREPGS